MILLLDAHAVLWWLADEAALDAAARSAIADPTNGVLVSAATIWEIEIKRALGKLDAPAGLLDAVEEAGFDVLPITGPDAELAGSLPAHHRDPFDRMLVAQADRVGAIVVSRDAAFMAYGVDVLSAMEFTEVVMKRRAVRRFEEGGVEPEVIERIARLAQRTPSAGFSQGQRLIVVTDPERRREVARICGEDEMVELFGPWVSECAAQFIPCVSEAIYHRRYQEADKVQDDGSEIEWPVPFWWVDIGATMQTIMLAAVDEGLGCGFIGPEVEGLRAYLGIPDEFTPIGVMPVGRPIPDVRSPSLKRGWVPFEDFARWDGWG